MGYRISQHLRPQHTFLHLNGSYHSLQNGGIIPYLRRYAPKTRIVTITTVLQEDVEALEESLPRYGRLHPHRPRRHDPHALSSPITLRNEQAQLHCH